jgi:hypothetical protein
MYTSLEIIRVIKSGRIGWAGHVACIGVVSNSCNILVGKTEGKRQCERTRHRWDDNIRMDLRKLACECVEWML